MRRTACSLLLYCATSLTAAIPAAAQVTEVDTFTVGGLSFGTLDVAVGTDGTIVFTWAETVDGERRALIRRYSAAATPLGAAMPIDDTNDVRDTAVGARPDGTFLAAWHRSNHGSTLYLRHLDATGTPLAPAFTASSEDRLINDVFAVTGVPAGALIVWRQFSAHARFYDAADAPRGPAFAVDGAARADAAALPDGGFIFVSESGVRLYDGDGTPRGPELPIGFDFRPERVATNPNGDVVVVGRGTGGLGGGRSIFLQRLTATGALVGDEVLVHPAYADESWIPDVDVDFQGNALVVWAGSDGGSAATQAVRGRAFDPGNAPLGHTFVLDDALSDAVRVARLRDGRFVTVWSSFGSVSAKVLSLCLPGVAQCGDGVRHEECEECDDGAANSDSAPDACRTDCSLPRCGDRTIDGGEQCDDGNLRNCDGCKVSCVSEPGLVCGDGLPEPTCSQPCDDANATIGDGCTAQCTLEPIPGGGSRFTDCRSVWVVDNPGNDPLTDKHGIFRTSQRCVDDDPTCDFDGGTSGSCTFRLRVCANASGFADCTAEGRLASWSLARPSEKDAAAKPVLAAVRATMSGVPGAVVGPTTPDVCSDWLPVTVPLRGVAGAYKKTTLSLTGRAALYDGGVDKDKLKLTCVPAGS
jgi:cysteine-rich repeat protein